MSQMPKQYDPQKHEPLIYKQWEKSDAFKPNRGKPFTRQDKKPFTIMLPLPNITGSLHMGHALQHTIMDVLIRYHRMKGDPTLWQPGTDHAGIATQNVVEKKLRAAGTSRHELGREKFLEQVWQWRDKSGQEIIAQMKRLGASCDWSRLVFTMDEDYVKAVQEAFIRYYRQGYVYRGNRIVNWCPRCASVISDLEINHVEQDGQLYTLNYPLSDKSGNIAVATTRPETMLGDTAVAVHPQDKRYKALVGRTVTLPLVNRLIPIVADERVDQSFGTGAVKITPAHDPLDAEIGATHQLDIINVIGENGKMTKQAGEFANLSVEEARAKIIDALTEQRVLTKTEEHTHTVTLCDRCQTLIEPLISRQWFVDMSKFKQETIAVATDSTVKFFPTRWRKNFLDWMDNVHDWTISRQLWWGQRIPVWWKPDTRGTVNEEGNFIVSVDKPEGDGWEQDPDVFDTWFSSALWPMVTLGWPRNTADLKTFYPTSVLISARDILYLWIARMIFSGLTFMQGKEYGNRDQADRIPFEHIFIHPTVLTKTGQRMSKSLGTGIDPLKLVDQYGADATRFGLMYQMAYDNQAIKFDEDNIKSARNFTNKIWNIARFLSSMPEQDNKTIADQWIQDRLNQVTKEITGQLETYHVGEAAQLIYDFLWHDYADWYVEILKEKGSTAIARSVFAQTMILLHPYMPHLTEVLWQYQNNKTMLITTAWPTAIHQSSATDAIKDMSLFQAQVNAVRSARTLVSIPAGETIQLYVDRLILPDALQKMCRAKITAENEPNQENALSVPVVQGNNLIIYSPFITGKTLQAAQKKLDRTITQLENLVTKQQTNLTQMEGRDPKQAISDKKADISTLRIKLKNAQQSRDIIRK